MIKSKCNTSYALVKCKRTGTVSPLVDIPARQSWRNGRAQPASSGSDLRRRCRSEAVNQARHRGRVDWEADMRRWLADRRSDMMEGALTFSLTAGRRRQPRSKPVQRRRAGRGRLVRVQLPRQSDADLRRSQRLPGWYGRQRLPQRGVEIARPRLVSLTLAPCASQYEAAKSAGASNARQRR